MGVDRYFRPSRAANRDRRWPALRLQALRRDGWRCVQCGARGRLEVDHIEPVRDYSHLAFDLANLQSLCGRCHAKKTRSEIGLPTISDARKKWLAAVDVLAKRKR